MSVSASTEHDAQASIALWCRSACFALGLAVTIQSGRGEQGELRIRYRTLDQFEDIYAKLSGD